MKRLLDIRPHDMHQVQKKDLLNAIKASEGRTMVAEVIAPAPALLWDVSNPELASAFGADLLILNMYDTEHPSIFAYPYEGSTLLKDLSQSVGRMVGINLEPISDAALMDEKTDISSGRVASVASAEKAYQQGAQYVLLTGNPKTGVTNEEIIKSIKKIAEALGDKLIIMAGKMHSAGIASETSRQMLNTDDIDAFIEAGSDIILIPAPGTVPGFSESYVAELVDHVHLKGKLAMSAIGTSQEGADKETIKAIALAAKRAGVDLHHIGDAGYPGIAVPENIMHYSIAIRGIRHTYRRMAMRK
jgi:hypothetical protein